MASFNIKHRSKSPFKRRYVIIPVVTLLTLGLLFAVLEKTGTINFIKNPDEQKPATSDGINYNPPTEEDAKAVDNTKEDIVKDQESQPSSPTTPSTTPSSKKSVKPVIASVSATDIRAYVPDIIENNGTCTATFTMTGQASVIRTGTAIANAQNTICTVNYAGTAVGTGWSVALTYQSTTSEGTSDVSKI